MQSGANILIVAPDPDFRQSLGFVLEAEGCEVRLAGRLPAEADIEKSYDCIVIDDKSLPKRADRYGYLDRLPRPLVLLVERWPKVPDDSSLRLVEKPIMGNGLIDAIQSLLPAAPREPIT